MGRPHKFTLDFFLHDSSARMNRKIRALRRKHHNDGYATYFCLLETLCQQPGLVLNLSNPEDLETTVEDCGLRDDAHFYKIIHHCIDLGLFDKQLWESDRTVFSPSLHERYLGRLEERKQAAIRKKRHRDVQALDAKISAVEREDVTRDNTVTSQLSQKSHAVELQNYRTTEDQNYRTTEDQNLESRTKKEREEADSIALDSVFAVECEATQEELPLVPRDSESEIDLVKKTGGRKPKKTTCSEGDFEAFREIYNDRKPDMWAEMQIVNPSRQKILNQLAIDCDGKENAIAALANALDYARQDQWYLTKALSFENFATNNKILRLHEQQVARSPRKDEAVRFASNPANLKALQNRSSFQKAREMIENGY